MHMMKLISSVVSSALVLCNVATALSNKRSYAGDKAVRISVREDVIPILNIISELDLETWKGMIDGIPVAGGYVDLVVPASKLAGFEELSKSFDVEIMHDDLGFSIQDEARHVPYVRGRSMSKRDLTWWESYHPYAEHITWMEDLVATQPDNTELVYAGQSLEGREITGVHIWGRDGPGKNKAIVIHGNVHAREWICSKTVEYFLHQLVTGISDSNEIRKFVNRYDFYIFPLVNPDGFAYTQTDVRLWRKNRQIANTTTQCGARDLNRNWPYQWNGTTGASTDPCTQTYKGLEPGDAPENAVSRSFLDKIAAQNGIQLYLDVHSYGQLLLSPYGYRCDAYPDNHKAHLKVARQAADAIREVSGTNYTYGQSCQYLYQATGYSIDYAHAVAGSKYSFLIELRDRGQYGFVLPPNLIIPTVLEAWAGVRHMLKDI